MLDSQIVAAIVAGDPDGLAAAYDRYAAPLYAFSHSLLSDQADAADVVQDTFIIASAKLDGLEDPDLLKSWLFAVARNECHRRLRARPGAVVVGIESGEVSDETIDFGIDLERAQLTEVVSTAMAALPLARREVIELSVRQDFDSYDLASTLGVSHHQGQVLASHARGQFEKLVGALLVAHSGGRLYCDEMDELLDTHDDTLTAAACHQIARHVHHCRACSKRIPRDLQLATLLSVLPATEIARGLRRQVLSVAASDAPDVVAYRADVVRGAEPFDESSGFPVPVDRPRRERRLRPVVALAATAVLAAVCAVVLEMSLHHPHGQQLAAAPVGAQPASSQAQAASSSSRAQGQHSSTPGAPGSLAAATPGSTPATSSPVPGMPLGTTRPPGSLPPSSPGSTQRSTPPSTSPSTPPSTPPSTSPSQTPGTLSESPASVALAMSPGGGSASGSFTLTANGSGMTYSISVPAAYAGTLAVSPSSGSLGAGSSVTISVIWNSSAALSTSLTVDPGGAGVPVSYQPPSGGPGAAAQSVQGLLHAAQDLLHP
jgi:RNA polymerase sigma factor (sigma-70 family)